MIEGEELQLGHLVEEQRAGLRRRAASNAAAPGGAAAAAVDQSDIREFHLLSLALGDICEQLDPPVARWIGRLSDVDRPRLVLQVELAGGLPAVLKVSGSDLAAEHAVLAAGRTAGARMVRPLVSGASDGVQWLLLELLSGRQFGGPGGRGTNASGQQLLALTRDIAAQTAKLHRAWVPHRPSVARETAADLRMGLDRSRDLGLPIDADAVWGRFAQPAAAPPPVLLHGDLALCNVLSEDDGVVLLDPVGSMGPAEFDMARWVSRLLLRTEVPLQRAGMLLDAALAGDPDLNRGRLTALTATLMQLDQPWLAAEWFGRPRADAIVDVAQRLQLDAGRSPVLG
jgi:hypothetical protein